MKRKLLCGMTVLFMIIAVIFSACPADNASGGDGDSSGDETEGPSNPDGVVIVPSNPDTGTTLEGDSLTLTVAVNNPDDPPESYQWYSNTVNSNKGGTAISGATTPSFTPSTEIAGTTYYYVVITLESGREIKSDPYMVMVKEIVTIQPNNDDPDETLEGEGLELEVKLPDGYTAVSYQWWRNTANNNTGGSAVEGATSARFLPPTNVKGTTFYYVVVKFTVNGGSEREKRSAPFRVTVVANDSQKVNAAVPFITKNPEDAEYVQETAAQPLTVEYTVSDTIRPDEAGGIYDKTVLFQWYRNTADNTSTGTAIEGADARLRSYTPSTMTVGVFYYYVEITNEIADDQYVGNRSGKAKSSAAKVEIKEGARRPEISSQPVSSDVIFGNAPTAMTIAANSPDSGQLSYQWYKSDSPVADGTAISGATAATYTPTASVNGNIDYYYCIVTNTKTILGVEMTNTIKSNVVYVAVGVKVLTLTGLAVTPKDYDGTTAATVTGGTGVENNVTAGDNAQLVRGTARFVQADAGTNIGVELIDWYLAGAQKNKYRLVLPDSTQLKGTINKANGSAVPVPVLDDSLDFNIMSYKIVMKALGLTNPATRQEVEYALGANNTTPSTQWKTSPVFTGLAVNTGYYLFARAKENTNYKAGTQSVGDKYTTIPGSAVESVIVTGETDSSITVTASLVTATGQSIEYNISKNFNGTDYILNNWQLGTGENGTTATLSGLEGGVPYFIYARSKATTDWAVGGYTVSDEASTAHPRVTFVVNGGSDIASNINKPNVREVLRGLKLANDSNIVTTRSTYDFDYWYEDANYTRPYNFNTTVLTSFTLYARWVSQTVKLTQAQRDMLWINGGWFRMGNNNDKGPDGSTLVAMEHDVGLTGFWMGRYEITQAEWVDIMEINDPLKYPFTFKNAVANESETAAPGKLPAETLSWYSALVFCNKKSSREGLTPAYSINGSTNPSSWGTVPAAINTDWNNVTIVAGANGYRLPTEAQWEYACRAGANPRTEYNVGGDTINNDTGWYTANSNNTTHKIGLKSSVISQGNAWGLYDMHGNVAEWCWDKWGVFTSASAVNPSGPTTSTAAPGYNAGLTSGSDRVVRGGGYSHAAALLRSSYRTPVRDYGTFIGGSNSSYYSYWFYPYSSYAYVGLRLVRP